MLYKNRCTSKALFRVYSQNILKTHKREHYQKIKTHYKMNILHNQNKDLQDQSNANAHNGRLSSMKKV